MRVAIRIFLKNGVNPGKNAIAINIGNLLLFSIQNIKQELRSVA